MERRTFVVKDGKLDEFLLLALSGVVNTQCAKISMMEAEFAARPVAHNTATLRLAPKSVGSTSRT